MDIAALFKISHGVYLTGAREENGRLVGSCIDAVMVVEADPYQIAVSLSKKSWTCQTLLKTKMFTLSVLPEDASFDLIRRFGFVSSQHENKWDNTPHEIKNGLPFLKNAVACLIAQTNKITETSNHFIFLCDVRDVWAGTMNPPLTYADYQQKTKQQERKKTMTEKKWVCTICGYVYDGDVPFEQLPDDWVCPVCGEPKSVFVQE